MNGMFEVLASEDALEQERLSGNRAVVAAQTRAKDRFEKFVANAANDEDRAARLGLLDDEIREMVAAVCEEYGATDTEKVYLASTAVLGGGHAADCTCGFCENKGKLPGSKDKEVADEAKREGESYEHELREKEEGDDDDDDKKESKVAADYPGHDYSVEGGEYVKDWNPGEPESAPSKDESDKEAWHKAKTANKYIEKRGDKWVITQKGTGKVLSEHDSEEKANASFRAMEMHKHEGAARTAAVKEASLFHFADGFTHCDCNCEGCKVSNHCESDECISSKHSGGEGTLSGEKTSASVETGDTFVTETLELGASKDGVSDVGSPKIDKSKVPGAGGIPGADGLDPIDVPSKQHPTETQDIHETPDYWRAPIGPSETGKSISAQDGLAPEFYAGDNTDTWTGTSEQGGQASPVTEESINVFSAKLAKWQIVN